jgi:HD-GYP domain-containing protein (c-di-GMP phosphodiesterase class II)/DNA-binding CsgD family transcriptional regulator
VRCWRDVPDALRLADLLAALSLTTDLTMGQPPEKAIRSCVLATEIARHMDLAEHEVACVYYTTLLKHLGCTATLHEEVRLFGPDDQTVREVAERTDETDVRELLGFLRTVGRGTGLERLAYLTRAVTAGKETGSVFRAICEVATQMADRLRLGEDVRAALYQTIERWDGKGAPQGLAGDDVALAARIAEPATQAVIFHRLGGVDAALAMAERRSGGMFDPAVVEAVRAVGPKTLQRLDEEDPWEAVLGAEPTPVRTVAADRLGDVAEAFADMTDLKTTFTLGHSSGVAGIAADAAERLGLPDPEQVRLAGLLHDLGRTAVGTGVWEKPGRLSTTEWEQVRLHPYHTERILMRSTALEPLARIAAMHHERQDGSGYHRGASAAETPVSARLLGAADAYQAMTQRRPHRAALGADEAAETLSSMVGDGLLDPECARAVLEAAGSPRSGPRASWPAGLSDREVEVLRLMATGSSNRAIAESLVISPRTAEHHVQHIYGKIGVSTRAAAAMFAMQHGLLR